VDLTGSGGISDLQGLDCPWIRYVVLSGDFAGLYL